jgi:hypothetical protein
MKFQKFHVLVVNLCCGSFAVANYIQQFLFLESVLMVAHGERGQLLGRGTGAEQ